MDVKQFNWNKYHNHQPTANNIQQRPLSVEDNSVPYIVVCLCVCQLHSDVCLSIDTWCYNGETLYFLRLIDGIISIVPRLVVVFIEQLVFDWGWRIREEGVVIYWVLYNLSISLFLLWFAFNFPYIIIYWKFIFFSHLYSYGQNYIYRIKLIVSKLWSRVQFLWAIVYLTYLYPLT